MTIQEIAYQIQTLKMYQHLDLNYDGHSWYDGEIASLSLALKNLLRK